MLVSARMHLSGRRLSLAFCAFICALSALALVSPGAQAGSSACPDIKNKPDQTPHVNYAGVQHLTYCVPVHVQPGQNDIRFNATNLFPSVPGYITRFDPELVYDDGTVPRVDVVHLHHAVWIVNGGPQFAAGEEKTITQLPQGFGWRSLPSDSWYLNDMLHDLTGQAADVQIVWRIDFVPDTSPDAAAMKTVSTKWMDASGPSPRVGISSQLYPVFNALKGWGSHGKYTFPDQASTAQKAYVGPYQSWTPSHPVTLIGTAGHLHPGGLHTDLEVDRGSSHRRLFRSSAHYYEPAGAVSWDVAMKATPADWRVKLQTGDTLSVHATYDTKNASWYEVMGIMPVAVYNGTDVGGVDTFSKDIPQKGVLTHGHLAENNHHGGGAAGLPNPLDLPDGPFPSSPVDIHDYIYSQGDLHLPGSSGRPPTIHAGQSVTFKNLDDDAASPTWHTITGCKEPCNRDTGIAYPIANGSSSFDSGQLGTNPPFGGPAIGKISWQTPKNLDPGTYSYFCRVHPFMRGSFRVKP